jgi:hypothetical protein
LVVFAATTFFAGAFADVLRDVFGLAFALGLAATFVLLTGRRAVFVVFAIAFRSGLRLDGMQSTSQANVQAGLGRRSVRLLRHLRCKKARGGGLFEQAEAGDAYEDQIDRDDVIEQARHDQDQNAGNKRDDWLQMGDRDFHVEAPFA